MKEQYKPSEEEIKKAKEMAVDAEKEMRLEQEKVVGFLESALKSDKLSEAIERLDLSLNLFGKPTTGDKHFFLRIGKPEDKLVLNGVEEHIPRKDHKGQWIDNEIEEGKSEKDIQPNIDYIPVNLKSESFLKQVEETLRECFAEENNPESLSEEEIQQIMTEIKG